MYFLSLLIILIPSIQSLVPTLKLTFIRDERFFKHGDQVDIVCELINPNDQTDLAQLWHVDLKTSKRTQISRSLCSATPPDDSPEIFKHNKNKRFEFVKKNYLRIKNLQLEDSARYECNCPDCELQLTKQTKDLQVMKLVDPVWHIGPGWPLQEDASITIRCTTDEFYPYVTHKIFRNHHEITKDGKSVSPEGNTYPQKFSWEASVSPKADWHHTTLRCTVTEGSTEVHASKQLEVLFSPRFLTCDDKQHINSTKEKSTIECSFSGNPAPKISWFRQIDDKPITTDLSLGIIVETKDENHGKQKSVVTFDRDKLLAIPLITTTKSPTGQTDSPTQVKLTGENYYQQLLNNGFTVKLTLGNEDKGSKKIDIVSDANQARANTLDSSSTTIIQNLSTSIILFSILLNI